VADSGPADEIVVVVNDDGTRSVRMVRLSDTLRRVLARLELQAEELARTKGLLRLTDPIAPFSTSDSPPFSELARWWEESVVAMPRRPSSNLIARAHRHGSDYFVTNPSPPAAAPPAVFIDTLVVMQGHGNPSAVRVEANPLAITGRGRDYLLDYFTSRQLLHEPDAADPPKREDAAKADDEGTEAVWAANAEAWSRCVDQVAELRSALKQLQETLDRRGSGTVGGQ